MDNTKKSVAPVPEIVQVYGHDGASLYVNGKLVCPYFTCGDDNLLEALGLKYKSLKLNAQWFNSIACMPEKLSDCVLEGQLYRRSKLN